MSQERDFYKNLYAVDSLTKGVQSISHAPLPDDWHVVCADVQDSTKAIQAGRYRAVNAVGAAVIAAVLNVDRTVILPYVFEGDGAILAIPPELVDGVLAALAGAKTLAKVKFGLDLAVGVVSAADIRGSGDELSLAKIMRSTTTFQAAFSGDGWRRAERMVKEGASNIVSAPMAAADFTGFMCRWGEIPARKDHKLSLIVTSTAVGQEDKERFYTDFLRARTEILNESTDGHLSWHPLETEQMERQVSMWKFFSESRVQAKGGLFSMMVYALIVIFQNIAGFILFSLKIDTKQVEWSRYVSDLVSNSDYEKYSSSLMMVLDVTSAQADGLENYLIEAHAAGDCIYGSHRSPTAIITCYIREYNYDHVHFVDGGGGGYAAASIGHKAQALALTKP